VFALSCLIASSALSAVIKDTSTHNLSQSAEWLYMIPVAPVEDQGKQGVTSIPLPPALWLFGSGLMGIAVVARRRNKSSDEPTNASRKKPWRLHLFHHHDGAHGHTAGH
jgi:hypothetical protein